MALRKAPVLPIAAEIGQRVRQFGTAEELSEDVFAQRMLERGVGMTYSDALPQELGPVPAVGPKALAEIMYWHYLFRDDQIDGCLVRSAKMLSSGAAEPER